MAEQTLIEEGVSRFNQAYETLEGELQRVQKQLKSRRRSLEKQLTSGRRNLEKRTRKQVNQLRKSPLVKRARSLQSDALRQLEHGLDGLLDTLQIASKGDVQRIDRRLRDLNRKLKELERTRRTNGDAAAHV